MTIIFLMLSLCRKQKSLLIIPYKLTSHNATDLTYDVVIREWQLRRLREQHSVVLFARNFYS